MTSSINVVAIAVTLFLLRQGQRDRRELRRTSGREQASKVSWWTTWADPVARDAEHLCAVIHIANSSDQAIHDVFADIYEPCDGSERRRAFGDLGPHGTSTFEILVPRSLVVSNWGPAALMPRVFFRDADAQRWIRDSVGRLRPDNEDGNVWNTLETEGAFRRSRGWFARSTRPMR